ncbi:MAG: PspC domain-containing protein [Chloroflexota bacterium]
MDNKSLTRTRKEDRLLGGVCSGIANYFGIESIYVMFGVVALTLFGFFFVPIIYLILWLFLEEEGAESLPFSDRLKVNSEQIQDRFKELYQQAREQISGLGLLN